MSRLIGVEWEYNHCYSSKLREWLEVFGGKDKDEHCGRELVTEPLPLSKMKKALKALGKVFSEGAQANEHCGIHVHIDARDLTNNGMKRLMEIYSKVEPILYLCGGQRRVRSDWCRPCGKGMKSALDSKKWKRTYYSQLFNWEDYKKNPGYYQDKHCGSRYRGLNILPWVAHRPQKRDDTTVEFRIHRNTLNAKRVYGFVRLCHDLVEFAVNKRQKDIDSLPENNLEAMYIISPSSKNYINRRIDVWNKRVSVNSRTVFPTEKGFII